MRVTTIPAGSLTQDQVSLWNRLQDSNPHLLTPCLRAELTLTVGRELPTVQVGVLEDGSRVVGFFPFQRGRMAGMAGPVALCDYQAVIAAPEYLPDLPDILRSCGLKVYEFQHLLVPEASLAPAALISQTSSPVCSLARGFDGYIADLKANGKSLRNLHTKRKLLERDHGEIRFVQPDRDARSLRSILSWKELRFGRGEATPSWVSTALDSLHESNGPNLYGVLSSLYAGDTLVAAHFGIKSGGLLHYWFPAFAPEFQKYTPGWLLVYYLLKHLEELQCTTMDFGPGGEKYKRYFANDGWPVAGGCYELPSALTVARRAWRTGEAAVRGNRILMDALRPLVRGIRSWRTANSE